MLQMGDVHAIRRMHHVQGHGVRRIARELGLSRNTVRAVLRGDHDSTYTMGVARSRPAVGAHLAAIEALLNREEAEGTRRKQRLTAKRIFVLLREEHGYEGSEATVRRAVRDLRERLGLEQREAYVPLEYDPGVDGQVDFFEADVRIAGEVRRETFLLVRACYSSRQFVRLVPAENQEALFEGLMAAFRHFGGVFHNLWFDNVERQLNLPAVLPHQRILPSGTACLITNVTGVRGRTARQSRPNQTARPAGGGESTLGTGMVPQSSATSNCHLVECGADSPGEGPGRSVGGQTLLIEPGIAEDEHGGGMPVMYTALEGA
jgi:transposase